jgi:hypothetical protein
MNIRAVSELLRIGSRASIAINVAQHRPLEGLRHDRRHNDVDGQLLPPTLLLLMALAFRRRTRPENVGSSRHWVGKHKATSEELCASPATRRLVAAHAGRSGPAMPQALRKPAPSMGNAPQFFDKKL